MLQKFLIALIFPTFFLSACGGGSLENAENVETREEQTVEGATPSENLKANAIKEGDLHGQAVYSLGLLQSAYNESQGQVVGQGKVTVKLTEDFMLAIVNEFDGDTFEQQVNLASLNSDLKSFEWIVDKGDNPNPGVKIPVLAGQDGVKNLKNGSVSSTEDFLVIKLSDRKTIQKVVSGLLNAIRASRGEALEK